MPFCLTERGLRWADCVATPCVDALFLPCRGVASSLGLPFLNADVLARETGLEPYAAAETIASIRDRLIERRESFITETVLSDPVGEKVGVLARAAEAGFDVTLIYIGIASSELSRRRVRARVAAGGHEVPPENSVAPITPGWTPHSSALARNLLFGRWRADLTLLDRWLNSV